MAVKYSIEPRAPSQSGPIDRRVLGEESAAARTVLDASHAEEDRRLAHRIDDAMLQQMRQENGSHHGALAVSNDDDRLRSTEVDSAGAGRRLWRRSNAVSLQHALAQLLRAGVRIELDLLKELQQAAIHLRA